MTARVLTVVIALWAGSLVTICAIVAPSLFTVIPDRHLAGDLAGHFFTVESWLGLAFGGFALMLLSRTIVLKTTVNTALVIVTAAMPVLNEVAVRPFMESARAAGDMKTFGVLHGIGAILFGIACVTSLVALWRVSRPAA